ncbi:hypothetical protein KCP69_13725 [Salmonella enterica subsp. enterica]|nr:hypothetical protein KCP69_13725 [Salmonella enterica subsp. enterica]
MPPLIKPVGDVRSSGGKLKSATAISSISMSIVALSTTNKPHLKVFE